MPSQKCVPESSRQIGQVEPWKLGDWGVGGTGLRAQRNQGPEKGARQHSQTGKGGPGDELVVSLTPGHQEGKLRLRRGKELAQVYKTSKS